jgi:hypothetical protein
MSTRGEYFPVFGWSLFSYVANPVVTLEIEISRIDEMEFPDPINFFEMGEYFSGAARRSTSVTKSIRRIYYSYRADSAAAGPMLRDFEKVFLSEHGRVDYQFVILSFDPVNRWLTGEVIERKVVAQFSTEKGK